jgi:hypothetical protein
MEKDEQRFEFATDLMKRLEVATPSATAAPPAKSAPPPATAKKPAAGKRA